MRAGFGVAPITPKPPVWLAGFGGRTEAAKEVHEDLEARAVVLDDGTTGLCLVVCDLLGMSRDVATPIRDAIAKDLKIDPANVIISSTHTHSGPSGISGSDAIGWPMPDGFLDTLHKGCLWAASTARDSSQEATVLYGRAPLPDGFAFNRRLLPFEDPWISVLEVRDEHECLGVLANLGIHPVLLGPGWMKVATDWVGPFRLELEELTGGTAIELTGSLGDINPLPPSGKPDEPYDPFASYEETVAFGKRMAGVVAAALEDTEPLDDELTVLRHETVAAPVGGTGLATLWGEGTMEVDFTEWSIGDVRVVSIPGEAFHALGKEISAARHDRVLLAGIAPWHGYLPHPWGEGGYEEGVSYGENFAQAVREKLADAP